MPRPESLLQPARIGAALVKVFLAWLYTLALCKMVLTLNGLPINLASQGLIVLLFLLLLALLTWQRYNLLVFSCLLLAGTGIAWLTRESWLDASVSLSVRLHSWFIWSADWIGGSRGGSDAEQELLAIALCLLIALGSYVFLARFNSPLLALTALLAASGLNYALARRELYPWIFLGGLSVIAAGARSQKRTYQTLDWQRYPSQARFQLQALPVAALSLVLAIALSSAMPASSFYNARLLNLVGRIRLQIRIPARVQQTFADFSLSTVGFYPLSERLGGPVQLSDQPALEIDGYPQAMLLRGAISRVYDGQSWSRDNSRQVLRFDNPLWELEQNQVFDLLLPDPERYADLLDLIVRDIEYRVSPVSQPFQTVFLAGRPLAVASDTAGRAFYFDEDGQMFSNDWQMPRQRLTVDARILLADDSAFGEAADRISQNLTEAEIDRYEWMRSRYLQKPDSLEYTPKGELTLLARSIVGAEERPWQKALMIRDFLREYCQYNLTVSVPPADVDFVSWFLQTREGYCVYFATALTMLCRLEGIPARYVEGYYVPAAGSEDGFRTVTGKQAHAWCEICLAGVGWMPIDATPAGSGVYENITPTPALTLTPLPSLSPSPTIPTDSVKPTPLPTGHPNQPPDERQPFLTARWLLLLLLLPLAYAGLSVWWFRRRHNRVWLRRHFSDDRKLAVYYWHDILDLLDSLKFHSQSWETPRQIIERAAGENSWPGGSGSGSGAVSGVISGEGTAAGLDSVERVLYSSHPPSDDDLDLLADLSDRLESRLLQSRKWLLFVRKRICYHKQKKRCEA